jgi:hypothetical protein
MNWLLRVDFVRDERGGGTIMGLMWFMVLVGICGLAVDSTDGFRNKTMLQATADAAALAGSIDLAGAIDVIKDPGAAASGATAAVATAVSYSVDNMSVAAYGDVLQPGDVEVGTFDMASRSFSVGGVLPDSIRVRLHQTEANSNAVPTNLLRIVGLQTWELNVEAVAQRFVPECLNDGLIAAGLVDISSGNDFVNRICIHGQKGVHMSVGNTLEAGVTVSVPDMATQIVVPGDDLDKNSGLDEASREQSLYPRMVKHVDEIMADLLTLEPYILPEYITISDVIDIESRSKNYDFSDVVPGNVYHIVCNPSQNVGIPGGTELWDVVIVSECNISVGAGVYLHNVVLASRNGGNPGQGGDGGGTTSGSGGSGIENANINMSANVRLGDDSLPLCAPGGGVMVFTNASVVTASGTTFNGTQIIAAGDADLTAATDGISGISVQAGGNITLTSEGKYGLCAGVEEALLTVPYFRLVH